MCNRTTLIRLARNGSAKRAVTSPIQRRYLNAVILEGLEPVENRVERVTDAFRLPPEWITELAGGHQPVEDAEPLQKTVVLRWRGRRPRHLHGVRRERSAADVQRRCRRCRFGCRQWNRFRLGAAADAVDAAHRKNVKRGWSQALDEHLVADAGRVPLVRWWRHAFLDRFGAVFILAVDLERHQLAVPRLFAGCLRSKRCETQPIIHLPLKFHWVTSDKPGQATSESTFIVDCPSKVNKSRQLPRIDFKDYQSYVGIIRVESSNW